MSTTTIFWIVALVATVVISLFGHSAPPPISWLFNLLYGMGIAPFMRNIFGIKDFVAEKPRKKKKEKITRPKIALLWRLIIPNTVALLVVAVLYFMFRARVDSDNKIIIAVVYVIIFLIVDLLLFGFLSIFRKKIESTVQPQQQPKTVKLGVFKKLKSWATGVEVVSFENNRKPERLNGITRENPQPTNHDVGVKPDYRIDTTSPSPQGNKGAIVLHSGAPDTNTRYRDEEEWIEEAEVVLVKRAGIIVGLQLIMFVVATIDLVKFHGSLNLSWGMLALIWMAERRQQKHMASKPRRRSVWIGPVQLLWIGAWVLKLFSQYIGG